MSLKSVPGCLVSIAPTGIGEPVALTPGFGPHDDVPELALVDVLDVLDVLAVELVDDVLFVLFELPHAATTNALMMAARAAPNRTPLRVDLAVFTSLLSFTLARDSPPA